jgi:2-iminobutanoate/2-iminopropanoate deaminase
MLAGRHKKRVETGLGVNPNAVSGAVLSNGLLYASVIPRRLDGTVETGAAEKQIELSFRNLQVTLEKAGGTLNDIVQIVVFLTDPSKFDLMIETYKRFFSEEPYPTRATIFPAGLAVPGMIIELVVHAHIGTERV